MGKGYAVKIGALESQGRWVAYVDADLDLDPAAPAAYVRAEEAELDFAIGSKRHPDSEVSYPPSRRIASWVFQQLVRLFFRLDVRDTQVGIKVFRREVADQVCRSCSSSASPSTSNCSPSPARSASARSSELPIRLDYRFSGSGVRSLAVLRALIDTLAIFYRLRILQTYQRKSALVGRFGWTRPRGYARTSTPSTSRRRLSSTIQPSSCSGRDDATPQELARRAGGEAVAIFRRASCRRPTGSRRPCRSCTGRDRGRRDAVRRALGWNVRQRAAAAVRESRIGGGSQYFRFMPGNIRVVKDFPADALVVRRETLLALSAGDAARLGRRRADRAGTRSPLHARVRCRIVGVAARAAASSRRLPCTAARRHMRSGGVVSVRSDRGRSFSRSVCPGSCSAGCPGSLLPACFGPGLRRSSPTSWSSSAQASSPRSGIAHLSWGW